MPKIGTHFAIIKGEGKILTIFYNRDKQFHFKDDVGYVSSAVDWDNMRHESEKDLLNTFREALSEYHELIAEIEKVILIEFMVGINSAMDKTGPQSWSGKVGWHDIEHFDKEYGLGFTFEVVYRRKAQKTEYFYYLEDGNMGGRILGDRSKDIIIPHTDKAEAYLRNLEVSMDELCNQFIAFLKSDDLILKLETGGGKLQLNLKSDDLILKLETGGGKL
ncbi:MAG: hypothetical protein JKY23_05400 [Nitrospinaceae bacterium]|nr:hypothetical protein [Nitrospinaceae bacterium]